MTATGSIAGTGTGTNVSAEAVIATTPGVLPGNVGGEGWRVRGVVSVPNVAATGTVTVRVRENSLTGTVVGTFGPYTVGTAAIGANVSFDVVDNAGAQASPGGVGGPTAYVATLQIGVVANSGAGVIGTIGAESANSQA